MRIYKNAYFKKLKGEDYEKYKDYKDIIYTILYDLCECVDGLYFLNKGDHKKIKSLVDEYIDNGVVEYDFYYNGNQHFKIIEKD